MTLASLVFGPVQFDTPVWLLLIPIGWGLTGWIGRKTLTGMGTLSRRVALAVRLLVIALFAGAMAEPQWRTESKDVAATIVLDASRSIPLTYQSKADQYIRDVTGAHKQDDDRRGLVTAAVDAYVQQAPSRRAESVEKQFIGAAEGTNLAGAVGLALALRPQDAAYRLLVITDGNETTGSLLAAAAAAQALKVPIDVLPVRYAFESEVVVDQLVAPSTARMGENINLRVVIEATKATSGRLNLTMNDEPVDLDPDAPGFAAPVTLTQGRNVLTVPVTVGRAGPQRFKATFEPAAGPTGPVGDSIPENNESLAVTFVSSQGRVLVLSENTQEAQPLVDALLQSKIDATVMSAEQAPRSLTDLSAYDALVLVNEPAYNFSQQQQDELRQYVHDAGGGLVMIGGPESFGAGGWIGSPVEDALPVRLDPPQKRQMPRGALALVMHSIEMPQGVFYGMKTAEGAVDALSRLDLAGIIEYAHTKGVAWVHPLSEVGDGAAIKRSIKSLQFGDMPDYAPSLALALQGLAGVQAGAKHVIMITDGDAQVPSMKMLQQFNKEKITISTVGVFPHSKGDLRNLQWISQNTGGRHYEVTTTGQLGNIVQIFIKEAQTVKRSLIWEGDPFVPAMTGAPAEPMRGVTGVPPISGYIVAADREGLSLVTLRGKENDPIAAMWQYGLGRSVVFTSDASGRWCPSWVGWSGYRPFWEQHVRWAMRPSGSANIRVSTEKAGEQTRIIVEALDASGERLNFATFRGRIALPDGTGQDIDLQQTGPGVYTGMAPTRLPGSYVVSLRYAAPRPGGGDPLEGAVQAAITRPFADEFRALKDNEPLLKQVAAMTGGRALVGDPQLDDPWRREGLTLPVALRPLWLAFALSAIGLFLVDVGVRRVRIDVPAIAKAMVALVSRSRVKTGEQMGSLRAAREQARQKLAERAAPEPSQTASVKFEATGEGLRRPGTVEVEGAARPPEPPAAKPTPAQPSEPAEGMSRLLKAKKRAQDEHRNE